MWEGSHVSLICELLQSITQLKIHTLVHLYVCIEWNHEHVYNWSLYTFMTSMLESGGTLSVPDNLLVS